jgi:hypothetical protein
VIESCYTRLRTLCLRMAPEKGAWDGLDLPQGEARTVRAERVGVIVSSKSLVAVFNPDNARWSLLKQ